VREINIYGTSLVSDCSEIFLFTTISRQVLGSMLSLSMLAIRCSLDIRGGCVPSLTASN
jgi:hypothetical protein